MAKTISPIAVIKTDFAKKFGIPRQSGRAKSLKGEIIFKSEYRNPDALRELENFSHLWLIFGFSEAPYDTFSPTVRPPRLGGNKKVGVFASRSPFRPNGLGLSCVKLEEIKQSEKDGLTLIVSGVDLLNNTPIYDIKPYIPMCDCVEDAKGGYTEKTKNHFLNVDFPENLLSALPEDKRQGAIEVLREDPRPSYQEDGRIYALSYAGFDISFTVNGENLTVKEIKIL